MTNRWSRLRVAVAGVAVVTACAGAVAGASGESDPVPETEAPVTTTPPPSADELAAAEGASTRVGFIGLPPEGATPSTPEGGEIVVSIRACHTPTAGWFSTFDTVFPALGELTVLADGRLIWQKYEDLPEGANSLSTGLLEQRLTPEGVELMRSEASAALSSGEPQHCGAEGYHDAYLVYAGDWADAQSLRADDEHLARVMDPWSWLPATAWEDPEIRAYVPSTYLVTIQRPDNLMIEPEDLNAELTPQLPAAADLTPADGFIEQISPFAPLTTEEARAFAAALDDAGFEQDGLSNAYQLDYHFVHHDENQDAVVHLVFVAYDLEAMLHPGTARDTPPGT